MQKMWSKDCYQISLVQPMTVKFRRKLVTTQDALLRTSSVSLAE